MKGLVPYTINVHGKLLDLGEPQIMGILNVTPDSFYDGSRKQTEQEIAARADEILAEGGQIIDIGAYSSRSGADDVSPQEEMDRLARALNIIREKYPEVILSVDTFRADVARQCVEKYGVEIVNDISGGDLDPDMFPTVASLGVPYILMHMQGTPRDMQNSPHYDHLIPEMMLYFSQRVNKLRELGVKDIILDPGFGFAKTLDHNYELMAHLDDFKIFELPMLVGISRKSMIYRLLDSTPAEALNGTTVLNTLALYKGASILRVHDVKPAVEAAKIVKACFQALE